jgi:hypothetical protein
MPVTATVDSLLDEYQRGHTERNFVCSSLHRELTLGERFDSHADVSN